MMKLCSDVNHVRKSVVISDSESVEVENVCLFSPKYIIYSPQLDFFSFVNILQFHIR